MLVYGLEAEGWRPVDGFDGYEISSLGRVRHGSRILKPWPHKSGHLYVSMSRKGKRQVHRLVLLSFVGAPPTDAHESCHRDGNPTNNAVGNLYWGTRSENIRDLVRATDRYANSRTTLQQAREIRDSYSGRRGDIRRLATQYGLPHSVVSKIVRNETYTAGVAC